jgi:hypothetical protein
VERHLGVNIVPKAWAYALREKRIAESSWAADHALIEVLKAVKKIHSGKLIRAITGYGYLVLVLVLGTRLAYAQIPSAGRP